MRILSRMTRGSLEVISSSSGVNQPDSVGKELTSSTFVEGTSSGGTTHAWGMLDRRAADLVAPIS